MSKSKYGRGIHALVSRVRDIALASAIPSTAPLRSSSQPSHSSEPIQEPKPNATSTPPPAHMQSPSAQSSAPTGAIAWDSLKLALEALHKTSVIFPPLQSAIGGLISCIGLAEETVKHTDEYKQLVQGLSTLSKTLDEHLRGSGSARMSEFIERTAFGIQQEVNFISKKQNRTETRRLVESDLDEDDIIKSYHRIEALFRQLQVDATLSIWSIANEQLANTRLEAMKPARLAMYDSTLATEINRRTCTENTRTTVLAALDAWSRDLGPPNVYWMNGMAGTGKTTIACTFADSLKKRKQLAASFFCTRTSSECRDVARIVPTIAYQLARYSTPFQSALSQVLGNDPDIGSRTISTQFERLLKDPLLEVSKAIPEGLVVVIDALDECTASKGVELVLDMLLRFAPGLPLKFFVTSRPEPVIRNKMEVQAGDSHSTYVLHDIERSLVQADIKLYLQEELSFMTPLQVEQLAQLSGSLFIYAATAVRYIRVETTRRGLQKRLAAMLSVTPGSNLKHVEIDELYMTILSAAMENKALEEEDRQRIRQVLWTAVCAREPISVETLSTLGGIGDAEDTLEALQPLRSVLQVSESGSTVSSLHASFPEFLFDQKRSVRFFCDEQEHNQVLARQCFGTMKGQLRFNICSLESSYLLDSKVPDLKARIDAAIPPVLAYSCHYWGDHLKQSCTSDELLTLLSEFLSERLLFWMEVMNLERWMITGAQVLLDVKSWLARVTNPNLQLLEALDDIQSFVSGFAANAISRSTPHIYISALPFCHKSSFVYQRYWTRTQGLIELKGKAVEQRRVAALAIWKVPAEVYSVGFSPDGTRIVYGDFIGRAVVRDANNGRLIAGPFVGHKAKVTSVMFSPDGKRIASGSADCTIRIWDIQTGVLIGAPFEGHTDWVTSLSFSRNDTQIASGSKDYTVRVWRTEDGAPVGAPFEGHTGVVNCVAFSPDSAWIASGSDDHTIRVWKVRDGTLIAGPFIGHVDQVMSVGFSPDGIWIVSGSHDLAIRIWEAKTGTVTGIAPQDHLASINSVAFSHDGTQIVSGSDDQSIRIWNINGGSFVGTSTSLNGHTASVRSIALSSDSTRIVSGSFDQTVRIWNMNNAISSFPLLEQYPGFVALLAFSPDDTRIYSAAVDNTIGIWSAKDGTPLAPGPLKGHNSEFNSIAHSSDGSLIASAHDDHTILVWNAVTGTLSGAPLKGHTDAVTAVTFSPDGLLLASGSKDLTVRIWETHNGTLVGAPFTGHVNEIKELGFSLDGKQIISSTFENFAVRVWNVQDGTSTSTTFEEYPSEIKSSALSPDRAQIASGYEDGTIRVLNVRDGALVFPPLEGHEDATWALAFSPNGAYIASGSFDIAVRVWSAKDGSAIATLRGHTEMIVSVAFSHSGTQLVSSSIDRSIRLWELDKRAISSTIDGWNTAVDGWISDSNNRLLFWVPSDLLRYLPTPLNPWVISPEGASYVNYDRLLTGERWRGCYLGT